MLCAATELNFTLLLNKVAFLYLLNTLLFIIAPMKEGLLILLSSSAGLSLNWIQRKSVEVVFYVS